MWFEHLKYVVIDKEIGWREMLIKIGARTRAGDPFVGLKRQEILEQWNFSAPRLLRIHEKYRVSCNNTVVMHAWNAKDYARSEL